MKKMPLQLVIIELENGKRSVFVGQPLCPNNYSEEDCQVENVWFSDIRDIPSNATLEQLVALANEQNDEIEVTLQ